MGAARFHDLTEEKAKLSYGFPPVRGVQGVGEEGLGFSSEGQGGQVRRWPNAMLCIQLQ